MKKLKQSAIMALRKIQVDLTQQLYGSKFWDIVLSGPGKKSKQSKADGNIMLTKAQAKRDRKNAKRLAIAAR